MNEDIALKQLFDSYDPELTDSNQFHRRMERKLALIDEIRQMQASQIRRCHIATAVAFVAGIIIGGGLLAFILTMPLETPLISFGINFQPLILLEQYSRIISAILVSLMIVLCIIASISTSELVIRMKSKHCIERGYSLK